MLRWLSRLFRQRLEAESAPDVAPVDPPANRIARSEVTAAVAPPPVAEAIRIPEPVIEPVEAKETCPNCGRTSVFAGPPGHRYCMHCALRQELFDATASR